MGARTTGAVLGVIFGVALSWTGMSSPEVIRSALLFEDAYLFLMFGSAVGTAFVGLRVLRLLRSRALLSGRPIAWSVARPERRHVAGSLLFGAGWGLAGACPGPVATQLGQGVAWSLLTIAGMVAGILLYKRRQARAPASGRAAAVAAPALLP